jgi:phospholipid/cholesterol/gamma-HCH transport system substrate-binding protein
VTMTRRTQPSTRRGRLLHDRELGLVLGGLLTVGVLVALVALALTAERGLPLRRYYTVHADFRDVGEIDEYSDVRIAGQYVGQVLDSSYSDGVASVTLQLSPSVEPLRAGTTARIRLQGLLGAKYVDLVPSRTGQPLRNGGTISVRRTSTAVDVFHVLEAIDPSRQVDLREMLGALGEGFLDRGTGLNQALSNAPAVEANTDAFASAVNARAGAAARLVPATQSLTAAFDPVRGQLAAGFEPEARALQPLVDERAATQATLQLAPSALETTRVGLAQTDPLLVETTGFARAAVALTNVAPRSLREATALLRTAPGPVRQLTPLLDALDGAVGPTVRLTGGLDPLIGPATRVIDHSLPILDNVGMHGCDMLGFLTNWRSLLGYGTGGGGAIGPSNVVMVGVAANADLVGPGSAKPSSLIGHDPYPAPCVAATEQLP